jgi:CBS domain-containing protein
MQRNVLTVTPETTLAELADLLVGKRVGGVPVLESGAVVGVVSRSDFARVVSLDRALAGLVAEADTSAEFAPGEVTGPVGVAPPLEGHVVRDVMVTAPVTVSPETPIKEVADLLVRRHLHRVLVVDGKALCGVISALDIVGLVASGKLRLA